MDGSGYADGSRPTCVWSSRISWSAGSGEARLTTGSGGVGICRCWCSRGAVWAVLGDVRAAADMSFPGFVLVGVGVRVLGVTGCHWMSLAVYARWEVS